MFRRCAQILLAPIRVSRSVNANLPSPIRSSKEVDEIGANGASKLVWSARCLSLGMTLVMAFSVIPLMDSMLPAHAVSLSTAKEGMLARTGVRRIANSARRGAQRREVLVSSNALPVLSQLVTRIPHENASEEIVKDMDHTRDMALEALAEFTLDSSGRKWIREHAPLMDYIRSSNSKYAHKLLETIGKDESVIAVSVGEN
jgi:hypothetical protein